MKPARALPSPVLPRSDGEIPRDVQRALTLPEVLVVLLIVALLAALCMPAMQNMREISRRSNCRHNLTQLSLALTQYQSRQTHFPIGTLASGGPVRSIPEGYHHNWIEALLPLMDLEPVAQAIDTSVSVYHPGNDRVRSIRIARLLCPSAAGVRENTTCYAGVHAASEQPIDTDNDGVFILNQSITPHDITDGLNHTLFVGEKLSRLQDDLGWISGTRSSIRNAGHAVNDAASRYGASTSVDDLVPPTYVGGIASYHPGGAHLLMGGGQVRFAGDAMDGKLLRQLASRADSGNVAVGQSDLPN